MIVLGSIINFPLLSFIIFLPFLLGIFTTIIKNQISYIITLLCFAFVLLASIMVFIQTTQSDVSWNLIEKKHLSIFSYYIGVDSISSIMICLTSLVTLMCLIYSYVINIEEKKQIPIILFLCSFLNGAFSSIDILLFYIFFEISLIPIFFLIAKKDEQKNIIAAFKLFFYSIFGSIILLITIIYIYFARNMHDIFDVGVAISTLSKDKKLIIWIALFIAFAIKMPIFPLHSWLPDSHSNATIPGSVLLAAIVLKLGPYGMLRFIVPFFHEINQIASPTLSFIGAIGVVYGAIAAFSQNDIKKIIAYSSISHMGFITSGMFINNTNALMGSIFQMISHGLSSAALFFCTGFLYSRVKSRKTEDYGGLFHITPKLAGLFTVFMFSAIGVPGTSGFISEFLIILGVSSLSRATMITLLIGLIFSASYMLLFYQKIFTGPINSHYTGSSKITDLSKPEFIILITLAIIILFLGIYPKPMFNTLINKVHYNIFNYRAL